MTERDELRSLCKAVEEKPGEWVVNVPWKLVPVPLEKMTKLLDTIDDLERQLAEAKAIKEAILKNASQPENPLLW